MFSMDDECTTGPASSANIIAPMRAAQPADYDDYDDYYDDEEDEFSHGFVPPHILAARAAGSTPPFSLPGRRLYNNRT